MRKHYPIAIAPVLLLIFILGIIMTSDGPDAEIKIGKCYSYRFNGALRDELTYAKTLHLYIDGTETPKIVFCQFTP